MIRSKTLWFAVIALSVAVPKTNARLDDLMRYWPHAPRSAGESRTLFEKQPPEETGVTFTNRIDWSNERKHLYMHSYAGGGLCVGDYDGDGRPDIYIVSQIGEDALYRQVDDFVFEDVTQQANLSAGTSWGTGATFLDIENDGDLDLFVCNYDAPNRLYVNQGDGTFVESAKSHGLDFSGASVMAAVADYDCDGFVDIYLVTNRMYPGPAQDVPRMQREDGAMHLATGQKQAFTEQDRLIDGTTQRYIVKAGQPDILYKNNGDGTFTDVSAECGISGNHPGLSATWWDANGDGLPDLYVSNDFWDADRWYENQGDGTFVDVIEQRVPYTAWFSMGSDFGDINNDGRMDFFAADMSARTHYMSKIMMGDMNDSRWFLESAEPRQYMRNMLYLNTGTSRFAEIGFLAGLASTDWTWSVKFNDLDNDGRLDLFATNGSTNHSFDPDLTRRLAALDDDLSRRGINDPEMRWRQQWQLYREVPPRRERNLAFRNDGDLHFTDVSDSWGMDTASLSYGAVQSDLDRDGDLDVIVAHVDQPVGLYRNQSIDGRSVQIQLVGTRSNRAGIGATIELETADGSQYRQLFTTRGFASADEAIAHFGLASAPTIDRLTVRWPSGTVQVLESLPADRLYTITEPDDQNREQPATKTPPPMFAPVVATSGLSSDPIVEEPIEEYDIQPLLPAKLSQSGPGMAWGDADGDGDDDLFLPAPANHAGRLLLNNGDGSFTPSVTANPWDNDRASEDMAALWFDFDGDDDLDLLVTTGSVEHPPGHEALRDRLYINDGNAGFTRAPDDLFPSPPTSTGAAIAADYDRDGDLDVFIAGRAVPGSYPLAPPSTLWRNDNGRFVDVTQTVAPGLADSGMVNGALWSDADNDGRLDLLLAREWGSITFWHNTGTGLVDRTHQAGLADLSGWWNAIAPGDFNGDGRIDYLVLNAGLNTKYKASPAKPALLYRGDFNGDGNVALVEAKAGDRDLLPVRGLSCSGDAIPVVKQRMPTYREFALSTLEDIYTPHTLANATVYRANELRHGVLLNLGNSEDDVPRFAFQPLPRLAQVAPGYGAVILDANGDGHCDAYFVQNFAWREPETGKWTGGVSQLLLGDGTGALRCVDAATSGLLVPGDGRALTIADINGDHRPDLALTQNNGPLAAFTNQSSAPSIEVILQGDPGNATAIGARLTLHSTPAQTREVTAGSGYLSQSSSRIFFTAAAHDPETAQSNPLKLTIRWPDGETSRHTLDPTTLNPIRIAKPLKR